MTDILIHDISGSTQRLLAVATALTDHDVRQSSNLSGWTVGHVLSHIAFNAEAFVQCAADLRAGRTGTMYPEGFAGRAQAIETGSLRSANDIVTHLRESANAFELSWSDAPPAGLCITASGFPEFSSDTVLLRRLREVEVHGADTGLASLGYAHWSQPFVAADLPTQWDTVPKRTDEPFAAIDDVNQEWRYGDTNDELVSVTRQELLAWVLDRHSVVGLPSLLGWGDQSQWRTP